jgi:hypothetical protein
MTNLITNFTAVATIAVLIVTNTVKRDVPPSNDEMFLTKVVSLMHTATYALNGAPMTITTNIPIATNVHRYVWSEVPLKLSRDPLSFPRPLPQTTRTNTP